MEVYKTITIKVPSPTCKKTPDYDWTGY